MSIYLASISDRQEIMSFINSEVKEGHILSRDILFFNYEHENIGQINFVISRDINKKINGILGFIRSALLDYSDLWTVIWKVAKNSENPILGIQLLQYLKKIKDVRTVLSVGINKKTIGIYKYMGMFVGSLNHFVILNKNIKVFKIAKINSAQNSMSGVVDSNKNYKIKLISKETELVDFNFDNYKHCIPFKNKEYFIKRYYKHPIYKYQVYGSYLNDMLVSLMVTRVQSYNKSEVLRIVDFIGLEKSIQNFTYYFSQLIIEQNYEYVDFYCFGLNNEVLIKSGFQQVNDSKDDVIIPNYFNPFVQENVPIHFFADTDKPQLLNLFKADGDQDRPS